MWLPDALAVKYPSANRAWSWQWILPSAKRSTDPRGGSVRRSYCRHAVKEIWEGRKQLHVGEHDLVPEEDPAQARGALFIA